MPPLLFKYRAIGPRTDEVITARKIWLAKPSTLNDPLDCALKPITPEGRSERIIQAKEKQLEGFIWQAVAAHSGGVPFFHVRGREIKRVLTKLKKAHGLDRKHRMAHNFLKAAGTPGFSKIEIHETYIEEQIREVGIFSLTEDPGNILMWSHYASNHSGLALGFDTTGDCELRTSGDCEPVKYTDELSEFRFKNDNQIALELSSDGSRPRTYIPISEPQIRQALFSKTIPWAYEKEWRYITQTFGAHDLPAPIRQVIFGVNCPREERRRYVDLAKSTLVPSVEFLECHFARGTTSLQLRAYA